MGKGLFDIDTLLDSLRQQRDEIRVQLHLARAEAREEWEATEKKLEQLRARAERLRHEAGEVSDDVLESARIVAEEIRRGYDRIRKQL